MTMLVCNLFGQPGAGKSTTAAGVFSTLKLAGIRAELVTEFAKDATWENNSVVLSDPAAVFGEQNRRLWRLREKVDVVITDSPIMLSVIYAPPDYPPEFAAFVRAMFDRYENVSFLLKRSKPYDPVGRNQDEQQAAQLASRIETHLMGSGIKYVTMDGNQFAVPKIAEQMIRSLTGSAV